MIIQNKHYFTTFLLTSEPKCNGRATNPALNCKDELQILIALMDLDVYIALQFINKVAAWLQSHLYPRGRIVAGNFSANMPAAFSGLGRLVETVTAALINSRATRPPGIQLHHCIIIEILVRLAFIHEEDVRMTVKCSR